MYIDCHFEYLASGESMVSIVYAFRLGVSTVSKLIRQCNALWDVLDNKVLLIPTKLNWIKVSEGFKNKCDMPNCISAIDGKHIVHQAFANIGSSNFKYKGSHCIILLAMCDADYKFTLVDIGAPERCSDVGFFRSSSIGQGFSNKLMDLLDPLCIDQKNGPIPFCMVADEAFPLTKFMMRPYPGRGLNKMSLDERVFNYRLSRARRLIENTFGIFASKFRIFRRPIIACSDTVKAITKTAVVLYNFIRIEECINDDGK